MTTPTLLVGAAEDRALPELLGDDARAGWTLEHVRTEVAGDHFSMLEEHAESTALAVHRWLSEHGDFQKGF